MPEYILVIGLVTIFLLTVLIVFRNTIADFTNEVVAFFQSASGPPVTTVASLPPAPPVRTAAPASPPKPSPTPTPDLEPQELFEGRYCARGNNLIVTKISPGVFTLTRVYHDGRRDPPETVQITSTGDGRFSARSPSGQFLENYQFLDPNTFTIPGVTATGRVLAPGDNFRRCSF